MSSRLDAARAYVAQKPTDRFGLYALAMELRKLKAYEESFAGFDALLSAHPAYASGYYQYAVTKKEAGDKPGAIVKLQEGLVAAEKSGDAHTGAEIESLLEELGADP
jgi:tetratricopeptide (TPR) repeat protein